MLLNIFFGQSIKMRITVMNIRYMWKSTHFLITSVPHFIHKRCAVIKSSGLDAH